MKRRYVILLTACVNPGGMPFTVLNDTSERLRQYREALDFYLRETTQPIVFCENTLCDFSEDYKEHISQEDWNTSPSTVIILTNQRARDMERLSLWKRLFEHPSL